MKTKSLIISLVVIVLLLLMVNLMPQTVLATETTVGTVAELPATETAYKLGMDDGGSDIYYFNGLTESSTVSYRLGTTTLEESAVSVFLEAAEDVEGGYRLYYNDGGTKVYIRVYEYTDGAAGAGKGSLELTTVMPAEYYTYDETAKTLIYTADADNAYYMGTYSTYTTVSVSNTSYITGDNAANVDVSQYPVRFYITDEDTASSSAIPIGLEYSVSDDQVTITGYSGMASELVIPDTIEGFPVVEIGPSAFQGKSICIVKIPDTVTTIGAQAFMECYNIQSIKLSNNITTISDSTFNSCTSLQSIEIPDSVTAIGSYAFAKCSSLHSVDFSDSIVSISSWAFFDCEKITNLKLPNSLVTLGGGAFFSCDGIETVYIPKSLENVYTATDFFVNYRNNGAFDLCSGLKTVIFEDGITAIPAQLFYGCDGLASIDIPDTVTWIGNSAFYNCINLSEVILPDYITGIGAFAFYNCDSIEEMIFPDRLASLGGGAFLACNGLKSVYIPKSLNTFYVDTDFNINYRNNGVFDLCNQLVDVVFEEGRTIIPDNMFFGCTGIKELVIPDSVSTIGEYAFYNCTALEQITIGKGVKSIKSQAFDNCTSLKEIEIPDTVTYIGTYVFQNCESMESAVIPDMWKYIPSGMFYGCSSLREFNLSAAVEEIGSFAFYDCAELKGFTFPEESMLKTIDNSAFYGCTSISEVILPEKTETLGNNVFVMCTDLEKVYIPQSTKTLSAEAFRGCDKLSDVTIADYSITEIKSNTFKDCPSLQEIVLPKGLETIGIQAFMNCTGLLSVAVPETVTSIASTAFSYPDRTVFYGRTGSYAETFANEGGFEFIDNAVAIEGMILKDGVEYIVMDRGETYRALFEIYPEVANDVIVLTSDGNRVSISGHDLYANYSGDTVITATATSGTSCQFTVHVRDVSSIQVLMMPDKTDYLLGESFDPTGIAIQVNYDDGTVATVENYTLSGFDSTTEGSCAVTAKWTSVAGSVYSCSFTVDIVDSAPKLHGILVETLPDKLSYDLRETLDVTGMTVMGSYSNGGFAEVTGYTVSGYNALKSGAQTITVTYEGFTTLFSVSVGSEKSLSGIFVAEQPTKTRYLLGEELSTDGLALKLTYSDGTIENVETGYTVSGYDSTVLGTQAVTVTYQSLTSLFVVKVLEPEIEIERATTLETGKSYKLAMDINGIAWYFNGQTESETVYYRLGSTSEVMQAVDVYLEEVTGGYHLYFMNDDVKTYIRVYERTDSTAGAGKGSLELVTAPPAEVYTYDAATGTLFYIADADNSYYMGAYSTYTTFSVSNTSYITGDNAANVDVSQYPARFYIVNICAHSYGDWVVINEPTFAEAGTQQKTCSECGKQITEDIPSLIGEVYEWNLSLADDLSINFYLNIKEDILDTAQVKITAGEQAVEYAASALEKTEDGRLIATIDMAAAQMTEVITLCVVDGNGNCSDSSYTVRAYCDTVLADDTYSQYHALVKEMLNYGAMAQLYFDYDTENLANDGIADVGTTAVPEVAEELTVSDDLDSLNFYGASLVYRDKIAVRYYFTGDMTGGTFTANGNTYIPIAKDGMVYVEIADILPQDLDQQITLTVTDAEGNELSVTYGPMNYIVRMNEKGSDTLKALVKALYNYHLAAKAL